MHLYKLKHQCVDFIRYVDAENIEAPISLFPCIYCMPCANSIYQLKINKMIQGIQHKPSHYHSAYIKSDASRIAPKTTAPEKTYLAIDLQFTKNNNRNNAYYGAQAASIARRNARERNRVKQVNDGFNALRKRLPVAVVNALSGGTYRGSGKKLSKVDTLRMVVEYIKYLQKIVDGSDQTLGVSRSVQDEESFKMGEGIFDDRYSYPESVPSPVSSDCSSGVASEYSSRLNPNTFLSPTEQVCAMTEDDVLDAIKWWK